MIISAGCLLSSCTPQPEAKLPQVILKLDDAWFEHDSIHYGWVKVFDYLNSREVVATIGVVGERIEDGNDAYYNWLRRQADRGHEIWNHGYCHCKPEVNGTEMREFRGTDYEYQLNHLRKTQKIVADKLGFRPEVFGAPYNASDENTARALAAIPELTTWLYPPDHDVGGKFPLPRIPAVNIEYPVHQPDFDAFRTGFQAYRNEAVLVIQGHPRSWIEPESRFLEFQRIIEFLRSEGVSFTTPTAYRKATGSPST